MLARMGTLGELLVTMENSTPATEDRFGDSSES